MKTTTICDLPEELVRAISSRLPVKVLVLCKCVCKPCCGLIGSPSFVKQHFDHENNEQRLLIRMEVPNQDRYMHALYVDESFSEYEEPSHLKIPGRPATDLLDLIGPLNGVFCVVSMRPWGPMALLNPAMRQFKPLPMVQEIHEENLEFNFSVLALGLDPSTGDYKVVLILYFLDKKEDYHCVVNVCTSESDSWRVFEDVDPIVANSHAFSYLCCTYLNGVLLLGCDVSLPY